MSKSHISRLLGSIPLWPSEEAKRWASSVLSTICDNQAVLALVVFGSSVRKVEATVDLDLLYVYQGSAPSFPKAPIDVDLRAYCADQIDQFLAQGHDLLCWAVRFGCPICEKDLYWTSLVAHWRDKLPWPSVQTALERARQASSLQRELIEAGDVDAAEEQELTALTHLARARLLDHSVFPASRPELPYQLRQIGERDIADRLAKAIAKRNARAHGVFP